MADLYNFMLDVQAQIDQINNTLKCPICLQSLTEAVRLHCAHHFCKTCISSVARENRVARCPICKSVFPKRGFFGSDSHNMLMQVSLNTIKALQEEIIIDHNRITEETQLVEKNENDNNVSGLKHETVKYVKPSTDQKICTEGPLNHKEINKNSRRQLTFKSKKIDTIEGDKLDELENKQKDEGNIQCKKTNAELTQPVKNLEPSGSTSKYERSESELLNGSKKYLMPLCVKYNPNLSSTEDPYTFISSQTTPKRVMRRKDGIKIVKGKSNVSSKNKLIKSTRMNNSILSLEAPGLLGDVNHGLKFMKSKDPKSPNIIENLNMQNKLNKVSLGPEIKSINNNMCEDVSANCKENLMDIDIEVNDAFDKLVLESRQSAKNGYINKVQCDKVFHKKSDNDEKEDDVLFKTPLNDISLTAADINSCQNITRFAKFNTKQKRSKSKQDLETDNISEKSMCSKPKEKLMLRDTSQHEPKVNQIPLSTQVNLLNKMKHVKEDESISTDNKVTNSSSDVLQSLHLRQSSVPIASNVNKHNKTGKVHDTCNESNNLGELNLKLTLNNHDETVPLDDTVTKQCTTDVTLKENQIPEKTRSQFVKYIYRSIICKRSLEACEAEISGNYARVIESGDQSTQTFINMKDQETQVECHLTSKSKKTPIYTEKSVQTEIPKMQESFEIVTKKLCESCVKQTNHASHEMNILVNSQVFHTYTSSTILDTCDANIKKDKDNTLNNQISDDSGKASTKDAFTQYENREENITELHVSDQHTNIDNYNEETDIDSSDNEESKMSTTSTTKKNEDDLISPEKHYSHDDNIVNRSLTAFLKHSDYSVSKDGIKSHLAQKDNFPNRSRKENDIFMATENRNPECVDHDIGTITTFVPNRLSDNSKRNRISEQSESEDEKSNASNSQKRPKLDIDFSQLEDNEPAQEFVENNPVKLSQISVEMDFGNTPKENKPKECSNVVEASNNFSHRIPNETPDNDQVVQTDSNFISRNADIVEILSESDTDMDDKPTTSHNRVALTSLEEKDIVEGTNLFKEELESNQNTEMVKADADKNMCSAKDTDSENDIVDTTPGKEPRKTKWFPMGNNRSVNNILQSTHVNNVEPSDNLALCDSNSTLQKSALKNSDTVCEEKINKLLPRTALSFRGLTRKKDAKNQKSPLSVSTMKNTFVNSPAAAVPKAMSESLLDSPCTKAISSNHTEAHLIRYNGYEQPYVRRSTPDFCITCTLLRPPSLIKVQQFASRFKLSFLRTYTSRVTHVIVPKTSGMGKTMKLLFAVAQKRWVVYEDWVDKCLEADELLHEEPFEVNIEDENLMGPRKSRLSTRPLFKDMQFCFIPPFSFAKKEDLEKLVEYCGGKVEQSIEALTSHRTLPISFILLEDQEDYPDIGFKIYNRYKIPPLRYHYIADCIAAYSIISVKEYSLYPLSDFVYSSLGYTVD